MKIATKDTFAVENVGGAEIRRVIKAGDPIPDHYQVEGNAVRETDEPAVLNATRSEEGANEVARTAKDRAGGRSAKGGGE